MNSRSLSFPPTSPWGRQTESSTWATFSGFSDGEEIRQVEWGANFYNFLKVNPRHSRVSTCGGLTVPGGLSGGPGVRSLCAKSIGRAGPLPGGVDRIPQDPAGRSRGRHALRVIAPTQREHLDWGSGWLARPDHEREAASWFLCTRSLPPGLALGGRPPLGGAHFNPF
jgi:hypothetical protein